MTKKLGKREMRVAIAKDVLKQLKIKAYSLGGGYFFSEDQFFRYSGGFLEADGPALQQAVKEMKHCSVCAIGAAVISGIRLYDGVTGESLDPGKGQHSVAGQRFFTENELAVMERLYEGWRGYEWPDEEKEDEHDNPAHLRCKVQLLGRDSRLKIVYQSIIDNNGRVVKKDILNKYKALVS